MRFARRLLAVCLVVAAVVALGFAWSHTGAADLVADGRDGDRRDRPVPVAGGSTAVESPPQGERDRRLGRRDGDLASRLEDLGQTVAVEALIVGVVVVLDRRRRRRRLHHVRSAAARCP